MKMTAYFDCGFSVREPMWHGQGIVLDDYPESWDEARKIAGLEWEPTKVPVYTLKTVEPDVEPEGAYRVKDGLLVPVGDFQAIARDDTGDVLAVPTSAYETITHAEMGEIIDAVLEADGNVKFETAGSVREGRQVWALAYLDEPYEVPGDFTQTFPFLALLNAHDGSAACKLTYTDVRVVCWNTWNAASEQGERSGTQFTFRHTGNVKERIDEAKKALAELREESKGTRALFEALAQQPVDESQVKTFAELFLPSPRDVGELCTDRVHQNVLTARNTFTRLYTEGETTSELPETAYRLLMSSTEYLDHVRGYRDKSTLMGRTLLRPEPLKGLALGLIDEVVGADWRERIDDRKVPARRRAKLVQTTS